MRPTDLGGVADPSAFLYNAAKARRELGQDGLRRLKELQEHLGLEDEPLRFRLAPSVITRSEAEWFGTSLPRFALRVYLDKEDRNFVNARRLATFCAQAQRWGGRRAESKPEDRFRWHQNPKLTQRLRKGKPDYKGRPANELHFSSCIADSMLVASETIREEYEVLDVPLGREYGEAEGWSGTPFMNHIDLAGGGLCAQASCFMAAVLRYGDVTAIHGVAEITKLAMSLGGAGEASDRGDFNEIALEGLNRPQIQQYLASIGLTSCWQRAGLVDDLASRRAELALALRSYVRSGFPVIVPTDLGRMKGSRNDAYPVNGTSIFKRNGLVPSTESQKREFHTVLVVGCHKREGDEFLINDPATRPFLQASAAQLDDAAPYTDRSRTGLNHGGLLAVTPKRVKLPLVGWTPDLDGARAKPYCGLLDMTKWLGNRQNEELFHRIERKGGDSEFRLVQLKDVGAERDGGAGRGLKLKCGRALQARGVPDDHWCWVQTFFGKDPEFQDVEVVCVWDAEKEPVRGKADEREFLLCHAHRRTEGGQGQEATLRLRRAAEAFGGAAGPRGERGRKPTVTGKSAGPRAPALISSFLPVGLERAAQYWPAEIPACDLYMLMQGDADAHLRSCRRHLRMGLKRVLQYHARARLKNFRVMVRNALGMGRPSERSTFALKWRPIITAAERMASHWQDRKAIERVAGWISAHFPPDRRNVVYLATYLPEIAADLELAKVSQGALKFVLEVADELRGQGHQVHGMELVGGSLIDGFWRGVGKPEPEEFLESSRKTYVANCISPEEGVVRLHERLREVAEYSRELHRRRLERGGASFERPLQLSVEVEPGPLNVLQDEKTLRAFCTLVQEDAACRDLVGVNLDAVHYRLAGIGRDTVLTDEIIRKRITHSHVSFCGKGHFGDIAPFTPDECDEVAGWVEVLNRIATEERDPERFPAYSARSSIELEAIKDPATLRTASEKIRKLILSI